MWTARRTIIRRELLNCGAAAIVLACGSVLPASAQSAEAPAAEQPATAAPPAEGVRAADASGDIVVTARRRSEALISVPVTVAAVSGQQLTARGINDLEGLARTIPQLILAPSNGGFQGGALSLRGIGATDGNLFGDQAVGFYIDGVMVARSTPVKMSELDTQQIEVLKGPQALFYGKNSPAGVVVIRSADPTDHFEAGGQVGYEFYAKEIRGQAYISGPLTESLGIRIAVGGSKMSGWVKNDATPGTIYSRDDTTLPSTRDFKGRVTLKFDNGGPFRARLKVNYSWLRDDGFNATAEFVACPLGTPRPVGAASSDCKADGHTIFSNAGTRFATGGINTLTGATIVGVPYYGDGVPFSTVKQYLTGLELSHDLTDTLTLTSTTGYYEAQIRVLHMLLNDPTVPSLAIPAKIELGIKELSEEVRLTSSFSGPFNFMLGGYYQDQKLRGPITAAFNAVNPVYLFPPFDPRQKGTSYSFFASGSLKLTDTVEVSGGARYSHEKKEARFLRWLDGILPASQGGAAFLKGDEIPSARPERSFHNLSPEAVITWRPDSRTTLFGSWKRGFISGGYNPGGGGTAVAMLGDRSFAQEVVEGFEVGAKALLLGEMLRVGAAAFDYDITGLQSSRVDNSTGSQTISNAASARSRGFELDATLRPVSGLSLNAAVAYTKARYKRYDNGPCYGGQTPAAGCNLGPNPALAVAIAGGFDPASGAPFPAGAAYTQQDLSGQRIVRAPDWGIALGANYDAELASGDKIGFTVGANYSSKIYTDAANTPGSLQKGYWLLDASTRYEMRNGLEIALIGRNLTNEHYFQRSADATLTAANTGRPTGVRADTIAGVGRSREIMVRLRYSYN